VALASSACLDFPSVADPPHEQETATEPAADAHAPRVQDPRALRMGAWNVRRLGFDDSTDIALLASLIENHFDLLALMEVMQTANRGHAGYDALLAALGPEWSGQITDTPRPNLASPFAEFYAVLQRSSRVRPCPASGLEFLPDGDGSAQSELADLFLREPALGCYQALSAEGEPGVDFVIGVYHARWGSGDAPEIAREVHELDAALRSFQSAWPREQEIFLLGDFNLTPEDLTQAVNFADYTTGQGSTLSPNGLVTDHLYDHLLLVNEQANRTLSGPATVLDVREEAGGPLAYVEHVSDHLPIAATFNPEAGDDD
jgi:hypothetical protein